MRHDVKYTQSHSAPVRQRTGSVSDLNEHSNYRYHHGNHYRSNGINGYSASNIDEHGGTVSALSGGESHESQKQWDWLEDVLAKSSRNKETVCNIFFCFYLLSFFVDHFLQSMHVKCFNLMKTTQKICLNEFFSSFFSLYTLQSIHLSNMCYIQSRLQLTKKISLPKN